MTTTTEADRWLELTVQQTDSLIRHAMFAVHAEMSRASADPTRPVFHFRSPARWMNGSDGAVFHQGYYHLFYQLNPYGDQWGVNSTVWGHTRSRDMVHWEHLPIAIPAPLGIKRINSGCSVIDAQGNPIVFFPVVFDSDRPREIWAALSDPDMIHWRFHPANPIMTFENHGGPHYKKWDQPYIFREAGRTFMILSSCHLEDRYVIPIYETTDPKLCNWEYKGLMHEVKLSSETPYLESPMIFRDGSTWAIIGSPCPKGPMLYYTGTLDLDSLRFETRHEDVLIYGAGPQGGQGKGDIDRGFLAGSILRDQRDRHIMFGLQSGFPTGRGWCNCTALPRVLSIDSDGAVRQTPLPELTTLRTQHVTIETLTLDSETKVVPQIRSDTLEIHTVFELRGAKTFGLQLRRSNDGADSAEIRFDNHQVEIDHRIHLPLPAEQHGHQIELHLFLDKCILELFINRGCRCATCVLPPDLDGMNIALFAEAGSVAVLSFNAWNIKPIWGD